MPEVLETPRRLLLLAPAGLALPLLHCTIVERTSRHTLVQDARKLKAEALLLWLTDAAEVADWLRPLAHLSEPLPVVAIVPGASPEDQRRGFDLGVQFWLETASELPAALRWAQWQFQRIREAQARMEDRQWTERAKGLLMHACALDEPAAHGLLRDTAMQARLRLPELARSVVQAAKLAEGVNLAGQQRMLSQRIVKLMAQRAAAIESKRAKVLQDESAARVEANLARLAQLRPASELASVNSAWAGLKPLLSGKPSADSLRQADAAAQALLEHSEHLTQTIEAAGASKPLHLVNVCGRQRMLSQRLAKQALLADLLTGFAAGDIAAQLEAFTAGLTELEAAPLSSPAIRTRLAEAHEEWLRLLRSLRETSGPEAASGMARSSEVLLGHFDQLTTQYQQSLQLILA